MNSSTPTDRSLNLTESIFSEVAQNLKDKPLTPLSGDIRDLAEATPTRIARDFDCVGLDYNAFYPGEASLEAIENLLKTPEQPAEYQVFFYHSDHLGSSSFITDINGDATQHLQYACTEPVECVPFGEDFVWSLSGVEGHQQNTAAYYTPYTFSGKERDLETSLSYFGARYYEAGLSVWLSVDPMSEARSYLSPYNYCQLNPVMLVDPTGMLDDQPGDLVGEATSKDGGSVNFYDKFFSLTPGPESLPVHLRPSSGDLNYQPIMIAGNGEDDPNKKQVKQESSFWEKLSISIAVGNEGFTLRLGLGQKALSFLARLSGVTSFLFLQGDSSPRMLTKGGLEKLTDDEIRALEKAGVDVHAEKGNKRTGRTDLYRNENGDIYVMPKGGQGTGEPIGYNIKDFKIN